MSGLLEALDGDTPFTDGAAVSVDSAVSDAALVRAMLDVEAALVRALERLGLAPPGAGDAVTEALAALDVDPDDLGRRAVADGNPVVPLVSQASGAVPKAYRAMVHLGATSQDVLDTALMLCAYRSLERVLENLSRARAAAARLAEQHRATPMVARTLGQPALPATFGLKAAGWLAGLTAAAASLHDVRTRSLAAQLGGAAGTLAAYGDQGLDVAAALARELGLAEAGVPWHTERSRVHALAAALGSATAAAGKVATDVVLMSQAETGEATEGAPGGSSAMSHKQNPVGSVLVVAAARRTPGLVATVLAAGMHENERATGSWHAEWVPLRDLLRLTGGAVARVADVLEGLVVNVDALRRNLDAAGPGVLSESVAGLLTGALGRAVAQDVARRAVDSSSGGGVPLAEAVAEDPRVAELLTSDHLSHAQVDAATDGRGYLGSADAIVTRVLASYRDAP